MLLISQVRKLEFLLAEALEQNCDSIVACGAAQSNCARACAIAARQLGLHPYLLLGMEGGAVSQSNDHLYVSSVQHGMQYVYIFFTTN